MYSFPSLTSSISLRFGLQKHLFSTYQRPRVARDADVLIAEMTSRFALLEPATLSRNGRSGCCPMHLKLTFIDRAGQREHFSSIPDEIRSFPAEISVRQLECFAYSWTLLVKFDVPHSIKQTFKLLDSIEEDEWNLFVSFRSKSDLIRLKYWPSKSAKTPGSAPSSKVIPLVSIATRL